MKNKIIQIGKEVIYLCAKYSNYSQEDKTKILKKFWEYKSQLNDENCKYTQTVLWFIQDLENDIIENRKLQIDSIQHDDYLENYFVSKREITHYNNLLNWKIYREIFDEFYGQKDENKILILAKKLSQNFQDEYKNISCENIAKNLLIFSNFDKKIISQWLKNLYKIFTLLPNNSQLFIELRKINSLYYSLIQEVYQNWVSFYNKDDYNVFFMKFSSKEIGGGKTHNLIKSNASLEWFRTWNPKYEYKQLLLKLRY